MARNGCAINRLHDIGRLRHVDHGWKKRSVEIGFATQKMGDHCVALTVCDNQCLTSVAPTETACSIVWSTSAANATLWERVNQVKPFPSGDTVASSARDSRLYKPNQLPLRVKKATSGGDSILGKPKPSW